MAWLEERRGRFRVCFRYGSKKFRHELKTKIEREAQALVGRVEENLILLERGKLDPPADGNLALFLLSDGKLNDKPKVEVSLPLSMFFRRYREEFTKGAKEANTRYTEKIHMDHLERVIGPRTGIRSITSETLQKYADERAAERGPKGRPISRVSSCRVGWLCRTNAEVHNGPDLAGGDIIQCSKQAETKTNSGPPKTG